MTTPKQYIRIRDWFKLMEIEMELFEVQGLFATNPEGDSKMDVVEVVPSVCPVPGQLVWMNV